MKKEIKNGDVVYSTGVYLMRDTSATGGWIVTEFSDGLFFDGDEVVMQMQEDEKGVLFFVEKDK